MKEKPGDQEYKKKLSELYGNFCGNVQKVGDYFYYRANDLLRVRLKLKEKQVEPV